MLSRQFVYKPLRIEQCTYKYTQNNEERSFTVHRRCTPVERHRILEQPSRQATSHVRRRRKEFLDPSSDHYLEFNISIFRQQALSFHEPSKVKELIKNDRSLLKKPRRVIDFERLVQAQTKSQYKRSIKKKVTQMLEKQESKEEESNLFRKVESPQGELNDRDQFTKKITHLNEIREMESDPEARIQRKIQEYIKRKSTILLNMSQKMQPSQQSRQQTSQSSDTELKVSQNFLMNFVGLEKQKPDLKEVKDTELEAKKFQYWDEDKKFRRKKAGAVFSSSVKQKFLIMKKLILECVRKMKFMKLSRCELLQDKVLQRRPYQREGSYMFFKGVEKNDIDLVHLMLTKCRYYAFDVNENFQTALHVCARKGWLKIMEMLFDSGAYQDSKDICGRTPLYYAVQFQRKEICQTLLSHQANPWSYKDCDYETSNPVIKKLLKIARRLDILLFMSPYKNREKIWRAYKNLFFET